jgi:hypothetical protein
MLSALILLLAPCQDFDDLAERLRGATDRASYDSQLAYSAAKELADIRSVEAMELRLELYDRKWTTYRGVYLRDWFYSGMQQASSPAEAALLAEAAADDDRSDALRMLCLQALEAGTAQVPAGPLLERGFVKAAPELRRAWQRTLGSLAASGRLDTSAVKGKDPAAQIAKLLAKAPPAGGLAAVSGAAASEALVATVAKSKDGVDRALALRALAGVDAEAFMRAGERAFRDELPGLRCAYLEAAVAKRVHRAVPGILRSMRWAADEELARWPADCGTALRRLTGMRLGNDPALWERWWKDRGEAWLAQAESGTTEALPEPEPSDTVARFFGLAVDSQNVVVLVDGSGSMSTNMLGELNCAQAAATEAERFLMSLGKDAYFNVGVIEVKPALAFDKPAKVKKRNIEDAVDFLRRREYKSRSSLVEALQAAAADPRFDTVVLISDGGSSDGLHQHPEHMLEAARHLHAGTGLRIHTILITDSKKHERFMRELAEATGGRATRAEG